MKQRLQEFIRANFKREIAPISKGIQNMFEFIISCFTIGVLRLIITGSYCQWQGFKEGFFVVAALMMFWIGCYETDEREGDSEQQHSSYEESESVEDELSQQFGCFVCKGLSYMIGVYIVLFE